MNKVNNPCDTCKAKGLNNCKDKCIDYTHYMLCGTNENIFSKVVKRLKGAK